MKIFMRFGACALLTAFAAPAFAQSAPDAESAQMMCDLAGQCDGASPDAGMGQTNAPPADSGHGPRSGATRGFTFKRTAPTTAITPANEAAAAPMPTRAVQPAHVGAANLRLSFASGSATLDDSDKARLAKLAQVLASPTLASRRARIEGHTDASGSAAANLDLSRRRAQSAADYLVSIGVSADRLEVVGLGSTQPLPGLPAAASENRRVMAILLN